MLRVYRKLGTRKDEKGYYNHWALSTPSTSRLSESKSRWRFFDSSVLRFPVPETPNLPCTRDISPAHLFLTPLILSFPSTSESWLLPKPPDWDWGHTQGRGGAAPQRGAG